MARLAADPELGFPNYHLGGTDWVLMDRCTICENMDDFELLEQPYEWKNYTPFAISSIELKKPADKIPRKIAFLNTLSSKIFFTAIYGFVLLILYELEITPFSDSTIGDRIIIEGFTDDVYAFLAVCAVIIISLCGFDFFLFETLTKGMDISQEINVRMKGKIAPLVIEPGSGGLALTDIPIIIVLMTRFSISVGLIFLDPSVEILEGILYLATVFLWLAMMIILMPAIFFLTLLPWQLKRIKRAFFSDKYDYVVSLDIEDFYSKMCSELEHAKENFQTPLEELITGKEGNEVEYKGSYWTNEGDYKKNLILQDMVIKVVAGFLNSKKGGHLLIGIKDGTTEPTGLVDEDIKQLRTNPSWDQLEEHIVNTLRDNLISDHRPFANEEYILKEEEWKGERIIHIHIPQQSKKPVYALQKAVQRKKLSKWKQNQQKLEEKERYPEGQEPPKMKLDFKFRFLREQTSTRHQTEAKWLSHWLISDE